MTVLLTCDRYQVVREVRPDEGWDLPVLCLEEERRRADGFAVVASHDGRIVADAEGWWEDRESVPPHDAARRSLRWKTRPRSRR